MTMNYTTIKELAKKSNLKVTDLIALAPQNDPFYAGTPGDWTAAQWFADLWQRFGYDNGVHIRRVHYQIISQSPAVTMPNGKPYENTEGCWDFLNQASKMARYLGLVDVGAFVDRRNPDPKLFTQWQQEEPALHVDPGLWGAPSLPDFPSLPRLWVDNYIGEQRYHLEIWCEKSTMNDVLLPLCERYGINLVTGVGELSITAVLQLVSRMRPDKPVRIFYVSDFDPAGQSMPVAVARKVEYFLQEGRCNGSDIRLYPVVLTIDQVKRYRLPRTPIKETEKRAGKFEDRYGEGAVELDALEALYPGRLAEILIGEIGRYYDQELASRVRQAERAVQTDLFDLRQAITDRYQNEIDALEDEYAIIKSEFEERMRSYGNRLQAVWQAISDELEAQSPDLADYPIPEAEEAREDIDALYDSQRDYRKQIESYKLFQGKEMSL